MRPSLKLTLADPDHSRGVPYVASASGQSVHGASGRIERTGLLKPMKEESVQQLYDQPDNWVFASSMKNGTVPIWPTSLMEDHVRPAGRRAGVTKQLSWKMFRTSIAT